MEKLLLTPAFAASPNQLNPKLGVVGSNVTLFGNNFNIPPVAVRFGGTAANVVSSSSSQIVATVPALAPQTLTVTVQTGGGTVTSVDTFQVLAPPAPAFNASPNQFNPKLGPAGTSVNLLGTNLNFAPVVVRFGATAAVVNTITATQLTVTVPAMAAGATTITIQTAGGSITSVDSFTVT